MGAALDIAGLGKAYGRGPSAIAALNDVDLQVPRGACVGLLGPNGAGKSTLMRCVLGLVRPSRGRIAVLGEAPASPSLIRRVGAMIESPSLYPFLTASEMLRVAAKLAGVEDAGAEARVLNRVGLADAAGRVTRTFSMGMRQRLALGAALLTGPELLILDEPTNGLDPEGIREMRALVRRLVEEDGVTVLLSSHLLDEVEKVCDRIAILDRGRLVAEGKVSDLIAGRGGLFLSVAPLEAALAVLGDRAQRFRDGLRLDIAREATPALLRELAAAGVDVFEARWLSPSLEDVFLARTASPS